MTARQNGSQSQLVNLIVWLVGICLISLPRTVVAPIRALVWDVAAPGHMVLLSATEWTSNRIRSALGFSAGNPTELAALRELERRNRELETQNALLRDRLNHQPADLELQPQVDRTSALIIPEMTTARVVGAEQSRLWNEQPIMAYGRLHGAKPDLLVLDKNRPNVDVGSHLGIAPDSAVYAGRIVVGRIANVGLWTSSLRLVTDTGYRGKARLYHPTPKSSRGHKGWIAGAIGILEGTGKGICRLKDVSASQAVQVGDRIFTAEEDGILSSPMFYGEIIRAELKPGDLNWSIDVRPALEMHRVAEVQILKTRLNPARLQDPPTRQTASEPVIERVAAEKLIPEEFVPDEPEQSAADTPRPLEKTHDTESPDSGVKG
ncbi:MAG: rod shape-determining protein MreC [Planctomycetales bacterium]